MLVVVPYPQSFSSDLALVCVHFGYISQAPAAGQSQGRKFEPQGDVTEASCAYIPSYSKKHSCHDITRWRMPQRSPSKRRCCPRRGKRCLLQKPAFD